MPRSERERRDAESHLQRGTAKWREEGPPQQQTTTSHITARVTSSKGESLEPTGGLATDRRGAARDRCGVVDVASGPDVEVDRDCL